MVCRRRGATDPPRRTGKNSSCPRTPARKASFSNQSRPMIADGDDKTANPRNGSGKSITRGPTFDFHRRNSGNTKQHSPKRANSNGALYASTGPSLGIASRRRGMISGRGLTVLAAKRLWCSRSPSAGHWICRLNWKGIRRNGAVPSNSGIAGLRVSKSRKLTGCSI